MKHTPGPWWASYEPEVDCDEMIQTGAHSYAFSGGYSEEDFFTGEIFAVEDGETVTICTVERERDAEIIAAAPEMLDLLMEAVARVEMGHDLTCTGWSDKAMDLVRGVDGESEG